jgi:hypothetical protein
MPTIAQALLDGGVSKKSVLSCASQACLQRQGRHIKGFEQSALLSRKPGLTNC